MNLRWLHNGSSHGATIEKEDGVKRSARAYMSAEKNRISKKVRRWLLARFTALAMVDHEYHIFELPT